MYLCIMKYAVLILLSLVTFLLPEIKEYPSTPPAKGERIVSTLIFKQQNTNHTWQDIRNAFVDIEQFAYRNNTHFRLNWSQTQQHIHQRILSGLKRLMRMVSLNETLSTQKQYILFNHRFSISDMPHGLYVYAIRHIVI